MESGPDVARIHAAKAVQTLVADRFGHANWETGMLKKLMLAAAAALMSTTAALAADAARPAVIYDLAPKFDRSFNEGVYNGALRFQKETGIEFRDLEIQNEAQREQALTKFAREGFSPILVPGFLWQTAVNQVAPNFPESHFVILDAIVDQPNVASIVFREEQGSFLVGMLAGMASKSNVVGFVGGMDVPLIRRFGCGFDQGAKYAVKGTKVLHNMTGTTAAAWSDPVRGGELAKAQMDEGADVVFAAAGSTGIGILTAAADAKKLAIGVDSNQNGLFPGHILTSMLKRVDNATYQSFKDASEGIWKPGVISLGLKEGGVDWALNDNNKALITEEMKAAVTAAKEKIISGDLVVHDYTTDSTCPE